MNSSKLPLVIILGATGTGKTKLSLELAKKFNGEVINADAMQLYKGLDIVTAKATEEERSQVPHHLLDVINPSEFYTVVNFRNNALQIINNLLSNNLLPIIVGGTNYYIESILWDILVEDLNEKDKTFNPGEGLGSLLNLSNLELHKQLKKIDPEMAKRLHPNNRRKIIRSLEIAKFKGILHSDLIKKQQKAKGGSNLGGPLRFKETLIFWLQCETETLNERLNKRVDSMLNEGLINELSTFHELYNSDRISSDQKPDYTKGVFQSIGFKEFHEYLILNETERKSKVGKKLFEKDVEKMKLVTRRYARKQNKWVKNRFLGRTDREVPPVYGLDTTDVSQWFCNVYEPAIEIIDCYIRNVQSQHQPLPCTLVQSKPNCEDETFECDICDRIFIGEFQWKIHLASHKHKKALERKREIDKNFASTVQSM